MLIGSKGNNIYEETFTIVTIVLTVGFFAYIIGKVSEVISDMN